MGNAINTPDNYFTMAKDQLAVIVGKDRRARVYLFDDNSTSWIQIAEPIDMQMGSHNDYGYSLALSSEGYFVTIGDRRSCEDLCDVS